MRFLEEIEYDEPSPGSREHLDALHEVYRTVLEHFDRAELRNGTGLESENLESSMRTITHMVVQGWSHLPRDAMCALATYFTYCLSGDDWPGEHTDSMGSFTTNLLTGRPQPYPVWGRALAYLPEFLRYYGDFCQLTILNSTTEFIQGCWIGSRGFHGLPGSSDYPAFLRRMDGLGKVTAASLFPAEQFDENRIFAELTTTIAQIEAMSGVVNDLFSLYKEHDGPAGEIGLATSIQAVEGTDVESVLRQITGESIRAVHATLDPLRRLSFSATRETVEGFVRGYVRWHLCDERYRIRELADASGTRHAKQLWAFREQARTAGCFNQADFSRCTPSGSR